LSLEKLGQTFFAVIMAKTPRPMGFLVYELNCHPKNSENSYLCNEIGKAIFFHSKRQIFYRGEAAIKKTS
jgi:hypothetical protein